MLIALRFAEIGMWKSGAILRKINQSDISKGFIDAIKCR